MTVCCSEDVIKAWQSSDALFNKTNNKRKPKPPPEPKPAPGDKNGTDSGALL